MILSEINALSMLSQRIGQVLYAHKAMLSCAESCTGGAVASTIIDTAGSSQWFERGFVTYTNQSKIDVLGVSIDTLQRYGAVSIQTAGEMALGVLHNLQANPSYADQYTQWAISTTGVAGPAGGTITKPVGMVCFGIAQRSPQGQASLVQTSIQNFKGDRTSIRCQAVQYILETLLTLVEGKPL